MTMRRLAIAFALVAFVAAGAAQPADAGPGAASPGNDTVEVNDTGDNETNGTEGPPGDAPGKSASFDARLMTAITTIDALTGMAPNDDVEQRLENALEILRGVQEDTDTRSLGDDNRTGGDEGNQTGNEEEPDQQGPPEDRGPSGSQGGGPPGFVRNMLSGIFG
jgi:hypothetical protein